MSPSRVGAAAAEKGAPLLRGVHVGVVFGSGGQEEQRQADRKTERQADEEAKGEEDTDCCNQQTPSTLRVGGWRRHSMASVCFG